MIYPRLSILLPFLIAVTTFSQEKPPALPPIGTNMTLSLEQILTLAKQPDDRSQMIPEIKTMIADARELSCRVVILTAEGQSHYPPLFIVKEQWVGGAWVVSYSSHDDFPGEDKQTIQAMTYDATSKTFIRFQKGPSMKRKETKVIKELGKQVGEDRKIDWAYEIEVEGSSLKTSETYTNTSVSWKQISMHKGEYQFTVTGSASKRR